MMGLTSEGLLTSVKKAHRSNFDRNVSALTGF